MTRLLPFLAVILMLLAPPAFAQDKLPTEIVDDFHTALQNNDTAAALALLSRDLVVFEFGLVDPSIEAYAFAHLPFDMDYKKQTSWEQTSRRMGGSGDVRWVLTTFHILGNKPDGTPIDEIHLETVILTKVADAWRIAHIHWSSVPSTVDTLQGNRPMPGVLPTP
jgi:ketosteroid isomerase-like protein